jgi:hypothetical protein
VYKSELGGVLFVEGQPDGLRSIGRVEVKLNGAFSQAQLKSLDDVKRELAKKVRAKNGNCLINFKYGQRTSFWTTLISLDDVGWYGSGDVVFISDVERDAIN